MPYTYKRGGSRFRGRRKSTRTVSKGKTTYAKRSVKVFKSKYNRAASSFPRSTIFNKEYYAKLKYQALVELSITTSVLTEQTFRINSCYDPDSTGLGAQPLFYDTLCGASDTNAPYNTYRVCGAKIKCYFINDNTTASTAGIFYIHWRYGGASVLDSVTELGTQPNTICKDVANANSPKGIQMLQTYVSMKKMMGIKDLKDDDNTAGAYNANPAKVVFLDVGYVPYASGVTTTVFVRCKITYYVQFSRQNEMLES